MSYKNVIHIGLASTIDPRFTGLLNRFIDNDIEIVIVNDLEVQPNSFEIDGIIYTDNAISASRAEELKIFELSETIGMYDFTRRNTRRLSATIDLKKEFELITKKASKLSKWERDEVIKLFHIKYKKVTKPRMK